MFSYTAATNLITLSPRLRSLMRLCGGSACLLTALASLALNGVFGRPVAREIWGASSAAWISRFLLGVILITRSVSHAESFRNLRRFSGGFIIVLSALSAHDLPSPSNPFFIPALSATIFLCFTLCSLFLDLELELAHFLAPWLALVGLLFSALHFLGYLYDESRLLGGYKGASGFFSAVASLFLGFGFLAAAGTRRGPLRLIAGPSVTAQLLRAILPITCGAVLLGEILCDRLRGASRPQPAVQGAFQILFATIFITGVVLLLARRVGRRLDLAERQRDSALDALSALNNSLAQTVADRTGELLRTNANLLSQIDHRIQVETALRKSESKSDALLSALPDWIFRVSGDGKVLDAREPRESPAPPPSPQPVHLCFALREKVVEWVHQNPQMAPHETIEFSLSSGSATYEARFVRTSHHEILAVVRDISEVSRLEREVVEANVREQRRIGEELHDSLGQPLTAVGFMSKILELELAELNLPQASQAASIGLHISSTISTLRSLARGLFRYELGPHTLLEALQDLASATDTNFRVQCSLDADPNIFLPDRTADLQLYRISQEAITNAVKHGGAKNIQIQFKRENAKIILRVRDDGCGVPLQEQKRSEGIGLRTMEFRTRRLGGRFGLESRPGHGTSITCTLPDPTAPPEVCHSHPQLPLFP